MQKTCFHQQINFWLWLHESCDLSRHKEPRSNSYQYLFDSLFYWKLSSRGGRWPKHKLPADHSSLRSLLLHTIIISSSQPNIFISSDPSAKYSSPSVVLLVVMIINSNFVLTIISIPWKITRFGSSGLVGAKRRRSTNFHVGEICPIFPPFHVLYSVSIVINLD